MKAIEFNEQNVKIAENQEEYLTLPAHVTENGDVYCCMELNEKDIEMIKKNGKIWLNFKTFGKSLQPFNLSFSESIFKDGSMWAFETEEEPVNDKN